MSQNQPVITWGTDSVQTLAAGTTFVPLNNIDCDEVTLMLPASGVSLDLTTQSNPATDVFTKQQFVTLDAPSGMTIQVAGNACEIGVRRNDKVGTPVFVRYIWRKFKR